MKRTNELSIAATAGAVPARPITAHDLEKAIHARYEPPEWHIESEVTLGGRRLDVVAFNLWGARQYRVVGFELKVSRGDWMRELDAFQKSEEWTQVVDAFYVVTPPKIIKADELPAGWGHLELCGSRMMTRAHAAVKPIGTTLPREVAARFFTRLAQRARQADQSAEYRARAELRAEIEKQITERIAKDREAEGAELRELRTEYNALLAALGVDRTRWGRHEAAMRAAGVFARCEGDASTILRSVENAARTIGAHHEALTAAAESLRAAATDPVPSSGDPS